MTQACIFKTSEGNFEIPRQWKEMLGQECLQKKISFAVRMIQLGFNFKDVSRKRKRLETLVGAEFNSFYDKEEQNKLRLENCKKTCQQRYGVSNPFSLSEFQKRAKQTTFSKYGAYSSQVDPSVKALSRSVCQEKYGGNSSFADPAIKAKANKTLTERYGGPASFFSSEVREKIKKTVLRKYGKDNFKARTQEQIVERLQSFNIKPIGLIENEKPFINRKAKCLICGKDFIFHYTTGGGNPTACPFCNKASTVFERKLVRYLSAIYQVIPHFRPGSLKGKEIDIFIPTINVGIEVNGLLSHNSTENFAAKYHGGSETAKSQDYHLKKTEEALQEGIELIHIWEHEPWKSKGLEFLKLRLEGKHLDFIDKVKQLKPEKFKLRRDFYPVAPEIPGYTHIWQPEVWHNCIGSLSTITYTSGIWVYTKIRES